MRQASASLRTRLWRSAIVALLLSTGALTACFQVFWRTEAVPVTTNEGDVIRSPVKAHLKDGSTAVFPSGGLVASGRLTGASQRYAIGSSTAQPRSPGWVPLDSIVAAETFEGQVLLLPTLVVSAAASAAVAAASALLMVAIFGSCPTLYAEGDAGPVLQAEGFSYAIAPAFEHRDVDPLRVRVNPTGVLRLELRNEALETHYIDQIELLAVRHAATDVVVPDQNGRIVALGAIRPLASARDRSGRDVRGELAEEDGSVFASTTAAAASARPGDLDDWIDVEASELPPGDSIAVLLRLRNSLLNTVLLYDGMLGGRDAADWLATGLADRPTALRLASWYKGTMGMRLRAVRAPPTGESAPAAWTHLGDVGPIAYRDVAVVLPRPRAEAGRVRVRMQFVVDNWRIDQARIAGVVRSAAARAVPVARVVVPVPRDGGGPMLDTAALRALSATDATRLETRPGQRMTLEFDVPAAPVRADSATRYLVAWRGWYREWIRGAWLASPTRTAAFVPGDETLLTAIERWRSRREAFEHEFYSSRIPVR